jgi:Tfp pilus assembly protein PilF
VFYEKGNTPKALLEYREAETFAENIDNDNLKGLIQGNLGALLCNPLSFDESISRGKKAIGMFKKTQDYKNEIATLISVGNCFLLKSEIDSAFRYYNNSIKLADDHKISDLQAIVRQNIGIAFRKEGKYAIAKKYLNEALIFEVDSVETARIFMNFSKIYTLENNIDSANFYINKSLDLKIKELDLLRSIYFSLSKIAEQEGNYAEALKYSKKYNEYVVNQVDEFKASSQSNEKYDLEKLKTEKAKLIINQNKITIFLFCCLIIIMTVTIIAFYLHIQLIKRKKEFLESKIEIKSLKSAAEKYAKDAKEEIDFLKLAAEKYVKATEEEIDFLKLAVEKHSKDTGEEIESLKLAAEKYSKETEEKIKTLELEYQKKINSFVFISTKIIVLINQFINGKNLKGKERIKKLEGKELIEKLYKMIYQRDSFDWEIFYRTINDNKNGFYDIIYEQYKELDEMEFRISCMSYEDLNGSDIAFILNSNVETVYRKRSEIREKVGVAPYGDICAFFIKDLKEKGIYFPDFNTM